MPELPEVESTVRRLRPDVTGRRIEGVLMRWRRSVAGPSPAAFRRGCTGSYISGVERRGKFLVFTLCAPHSATPLRYLLIHLRMSGRLRVLPRAQGAVKHTRAVFLLEGGVQLRFDDPRKFGRLHLVRDAREVVGELGPEPLDPRFDAAAMQAIMAGRSARIKTVLLNQRLLAGVGNIYADEALWRAGIHPVRKASSLDAEELRALHRSLRRVLRAAIAVQGTDAGDGVVCGDYQPEVYGREGEPCLRCRTPIEKIVVAQRGTHVCPKCQRVKE